MHAIPKTAVRLAVLAVLMAIPARAGEPTILVKNGATAYKVFLGYKFMVRKQTPDHLKIALPLVVTNEYQRAVLPEPLPHIIREHTETREKYYVINLETMDLTWMGVHWDIGYTVNVTLYDVRADFSKIGEIEPDDDRASPYRGYTGDGTYVDPDNHRIQDIAVDLMRQSSNSLDYARRCYDYVRENFACDEVPTERRKRRNKGDAMSDKAKELDLQLKPLKQVLEDKRGNSGDLNSVLVSLLRSQGVTARHLAALRLDDCERHMFADFYLPNYGWIPLDVASAIATGRDYFGKMYASDRLMIVSKGVKLGFNLDNRNLTIDTMINGYTYMIGGSARHWLAIDFERLGY